jgi:hypothetical protein
MMNGTGNRFPSLVSIIALVIQTILLLSVFFGSLQRIESRLTRLETCMDFVLHQVK